MVVLLGVGYHSIPICHMGQIALNEPLTVPLETLGSYSRRRSLCRACAYPFDVRQGRDIAHARVPAVCAEILPLQRSQHINIMGHKLTPEGQGFAEKGPTRRSVGQRLQVLDDLGHQEQPLAEVAVHQVAHPAIRGPQQFIALFP